MDRMKLLLQVDSTARGLTVREGWGRMAAEGELSCTAASILLRAVQSQPSYAQKVMLCKSDALRWGWGWVLDLLP